jgi:hypothetical protein
MEVVSVLKLIYDSYCKLVFSLQQLWLIILVTIVFMGFINQKT